MVTLPHLAVDVMPSHYELNSRANVDMIALLTEEYKLSKYESLPVLL